MGFAKTLLAVVLGTLLGLLIWAALLPFLMSGLPE
jgi:hypothetical protein